MIRQLDVPIYDTNVLFLLETTGEEWAMFCDNEINKGKLTDVREWLHNHHPSWQRAMVYLRHMNGVNDTIMIER